MLDVSKDLPQLVRSSCALVAEQAASVRIEGQAIAPYAAAVASSASGPNSLDPAHHYLGHDRDTVSFILALDAINFGSGYFPHLEKLDGLSGYFTVAHHLTRYFRQYGSITAEQLEALTADDCTRIFEQTAVDPVRAELMALFAAALNQLGAFVRQRYGGSFVGLVEDARHSVRRLVGILTEMPSFNDVAEYRGSRVAFLKRAQLTASDLNLAFAGEAWGAFADLPALTVFADNVLPHVLRTDGVLRYAPELAARIDRRVPLKAGSQEEVEIRACTVNACDILTAVIRRRDSGFCARDLDTLLWNRGQLPAYRLLPRHLCRTTAY